MTVEWIIRTDLHKNSQQYLILDKTAQTDVLVN